MKTSTPPVPEPVDEPAHGPDRRQFLCSTLAAVAALLPSGACYEPGRNRRPNVLFLVLDDQNDWVGCLGGHRSARTPNVDRLAQRGMLFSNAHCAAPQCSGSRTSVLAGRQPFTSGVYDNVHDYRLAYPDLVNLPQHFKASGYQTLNTGKMFHFPEPTAFHESYYPDSIDPRPRRDPNDGWGRPTPPDSGFNWGPIDADFDELHDGMVSRWASDVLASRCEPPFYLSVGIFWPHLPWFPPRDFLAAFPPEHTPPPLIYRYDKTDLGPRGRSFRTVSRDDMVRKHGQMRKAVACYLACMAVADKAVGRVLDALDASGFAEETIVVLWSDHGHHLGEKEHWSKYDLWEDTTRVPLVVSVPGLTAAGSRCAKPASLVHLYPTLVDLCDLPAMDGLDGTSLRPLLEDPAADWLHAAITTSRLSQSVRSERYRYIRYDNGEEELYDHASDPNEWVNLEAVRGVPGGIKEELAAQLPATLAPPIHELTGRAARRRARTVPESRELGEDEEMPESEAEP